MITREQALERSRAALADRGLDALVASSPENVCYTAGTSFLSQRLIPDRLALVAVTAERDPVFVYAEPGGERLAPGGVVRTDFGMWWGHYRSDVARAAFVAPLEPRRAEAYRVLEACQQALIAAVRPGVRASEVFAACGRAFEERGLPFAVPHVGHSLGIGLHEWPVLHPNEHAVLEPGMVFMVEPLLPTEDGPYHTEDMVLVTEDGHRVLARSADWAEPFVIS